MSRPVVVTLPITPRHTPGLGLMLIPLVMDIIRQQMDGTGVLALNVNGSKLGSVNVEPHVLGYLKVCQQVGIVPNVVWRDDQQENVYWINQFFKQLTDAGLIFRAKRAVKRCPCRIVETLANAENFSDARKLYHWTGNVCLCKICQLPVYEESDDVYLFRLPKPKKGFVVTPEFTQGEIANLASRFTGAELLISRTRQSAIPLWVGRERIFLDPDFTWQLYLPILWHCGHRPTVMIGSQKNLFGCYLAMLLLEILVGDQVNLVIPAYCQTKSPADATIMGRFLEWNRSTVRLFLAAHVAYHVKDTRFDVSLLRNIQNLSLILGGQVATSSGARSLEQSLSRSSARQLRQRLLEARRSGVIDSLILELS
ncbi:hypothetical protein IT398_02165 [Candidatus Nomurabacteria bacterium]|nr:hypothetical protein [Candidatus Nomurabacteria bacterium]